jgi:hypothetical protein
LSFRELFIALFDLLNAFPDAQDSDAAILPDRQNLSLTYVRLLTLNTPNAGLFSPIAGVKLHLYGSAAKCRRYGINS